MSEDTRSGETEKSMCPHKKILEKFKEKKRKYLEINKDYLLLTETPPKNISGDFADKFAHRPVPSIPGKAGSFRPPERADGYIVLNEDEEDFTHSADVTVNQEKLSQAAADMVFGGKAEERQLKIVKELEELRRKNTQLLAEAEAKKQTYVYISKKYFLQLFFKKVKTYA